MLVDQKMNDGIEAPFFGRPAMTAPAAAAFALRFQARVVMAIETQHQFPKDSSLKILTSGLLGEQYIGIEAGAEEKVLAEGDKVQDTQSAVVLENLISKFLYNKAAEPAAPESK
jgi:phospholipid/cholesterol/gamma-HCH transport system substrate-binding protein